MPLGERGIHPIFSVICLPFGVSAALSSEGFVHLAHHHRLDGRQELRHGEGGNAQRVAEIDADDLEEQELLLLSRAEVEEALTANAFTGLPYAATIALALLALDREAES